MGYWLQIKEKMVAYYLYIDIKRESTAASKIEPDAMQQTLARLWCQKDKTKK